MKIVPLASAALALSLIASPVQAQSVGDFVNLLAGASNTASRSTNNYCSWRKGIDQITCQLQRLQNTARDVEALKRQARYLGERKRLEGVNLRSNNASLDVQLKSLCARGDDIACETLIRYARAR